MKVGISSHTYAWAIGVDGYPPPATPLTSSNLVRKAIVLDVPVVQIADNLPLHALPQHELDRLKGMAQDAGIQLEIGTAGIQTDRLLTYLKLARELTSPIVRTLLDSPGHHPTVEEAVAALRRVVRDYEAADVWLAIENHDRFSARTLAEILSAVDSPRLGICLDTANSLGCGEDVRTVMAELAPWIVNLHIKDIRAVRLPHQKGFTVEGCPAGRGCLDIPAILAAIHGPMETMSTIVELWVTPDASREATILREDDWANESVGFVKKCLRNLSERKTQ
jgi:3-oxoisoapionate decarboxylase